MQMKGISIATAAVAVVSFFASSVVADLDPIVIKVRRFTGQQSHISSLSTLTLAQ